MSRARATAATPLELSYSSYADLNSRLAGDTPLLGAVAFGRHPPPAHAAFPGIWVDMPTLRGEGVFEIWESGLPVEPVESNGVRGARNDHVLFGALQIPEGEGLDLEAAGRLAYGRVFDAIDALGFPYLLRAWNYFTAINDDADGVERYRRFNVGRHDAFAAKGRRIGVDMPAACALGCREGPLTVYFVAGKVRGRPLENPRQVSAYRYPERYGPLAPTFSRAMLMQPDGMRGLALSGTASIVGHETQHVGDIGAQVEETLANLGVLLDAAGYPVAPSPAAGAGLLLKAYLRRPADLPIVESALGGTFGKAGVIYLQADICRSELLVEIEGFYTPR